MGGDLNLALAYGALGASSGWALMQCTDLMYARVAFGVYLATGIVGVVDYIMPKSNSNVKRLLEALGRWSRPLYVPLIAAEAILFAGFDETYSYCHLVFPVGYLLLTELLKKNIKQDTLDLSTIVNSISICYSAFTVKDAFGGLCAILNIAAFLGVPYESMECFLLVAAANLAAVQFFKQLLF
uniref:Uncharacterized protein n=1 Tax=Graphocephala atropunctata TaxID=36148 RepID=A0A1B6KLE8_9HEMI